MFDKIPLKWYFVVRNLEGCMELDSRLSANMVLALPTRSINYLREGDVEIGNTRSMWVKRRRWRYGAFYRWAAYMRPSTREQFRVIKSDE